jgi:hypothetical protein
VRQPLLGAIALALAAADASAQEPAASRRPGRYKLGPFYLTPRLELRNAGVDTNVFNSRTHEVADASVVLRPSVAAVLPVGRRLRLEGEGYFDLNYFQRQETERSNDFGGNGSAELRLGPMTLMGAGGGAQAQQRFSIDIDERLLHHERWASAGVRLDITRRLSATFTASSHVYEFAPSRTLGLEVKERLDRDELTARGQLEFALTNLTSLVASSEAIEDRFLTVRPVGTTLDARSARRVRSYRHLAGFELGRRALISGRVMAGYREFPRGGAAPYRGPAIAVAADLPLLRFGVLTVHADRDVFYATSRLQEHDERLRNTYVWTRLGGTATVALPFGLLGRGGFGLEEARYLLPFQRQGGLVRRIDHLWTGGASLLVPLGERFRFGGGVTWGRRVSAIPEFSYEGLRYGVQAELVP